MVLKCPSKRSQTYTKYFIGVFAIVLNFMYEPSFSCFYHRVVADKKTDMPYLLFLA